VEIICILTFVYEIILLIRVLSTWFRTPPSGPVRAGLNFTYTVTEPVLRPLRRIIPPIRVGPAALDLSPVILFIVLGVIRSSIGCPPVGIF